MEAVKHPLVAQVVTAAQRRAPRPPHGEVAVPLDPQVQRPVGRRIVEGEAVVAIGRVELGRVQPPQHPRRRLVVRQGEQVLKLPILGIDRPGDGHAARRPHLEVTRQPPLDVILAPGVAALAPARRHIDHAHAEDVALGHHDLAHHRRPAADRDRNGIATGRQDALDREAPAGVRPHRLAQRRHRRPRPDPVARHRDQTAAHGDPLPDRHRGRTRQGAPVDLGQRQRLGLVEAARPVIDAIGQKHAVARGQRDPRRAVRRHGMDRDRLDPARAVRPHHAKFAAIHEGGIVHHAPHLDHARSTTHGAQDEAQFRRDTDPAHPHVKRGRLDPRIGPLPRLRDTGLARHLLPVDGNREPVRLPKHLPRKGQTKRGKKRRGPEHPSHWPVPPMPRMTRSTASPGGAPPPRLVT